MAQVVENAIFIPKTLIFRFIFDRGSPLVPKQGREGSSVSQHDLFFFKVRIRPRTMGGSIELEMLIRFP